MEEIQKRINAQFGGSAEAQLNTYNGRMTQLQNVMNSTKTTIGTELLPIFISFAKNVSDIAIKVSDFIKTHKQLTSVILASIAVFGSLIGGISLATKVIGILGPVIGGVTKAIKEFSMETMLATLKTTAIIVVIAALAGLAYEVVKHWKDVAPFFDGMMKAIGGICNIGVDSVVIAFDYMKTGVMEAVNLVVQGIVKYYDVIFGLLAKVPGIGKIFSGLKEGADNMAKGMQESTDKTTKSIDGMKTQMGKDGADIKAGFSQMGSSLSGFGKLAGDIKTDVTSAFKGITGSTNDTSGAIKGYGNNTAIALKQASAAAKEHAKEVKAAATEHKKALKEQEAAVKKQASEEAKETKATDKMYKDYAKARIKEAADIAKAKAAEAKKTAADQKKQAAEDAKLATEELKRKQQEVTDINNLNAKVIEALKKKYTAEEKMSQDSINKQLKDLDTWKTESIKKIDEVYAAKLKTLDDGTNASVLAIQSQIDAIDDQEEADKHAKDVKAEADNIASLKTQLIAATDSDTQQSISSQLNDALLAQQDRLHNEQINSQKAALNKQIEYLKTSAEAGKTYLEAQKTTQENSINAIADAQKASLDKQLSDSQTFYDGKLDQANLEAESEKMIMDKNQKDIVILLNGYGGEYAKAGVSLGDSLINGIKPKIDQISLMVANVVASIAAASSAASSVSSRAASVAALAASSVYSDAGVHTSTISNSSSSKSTVINNNISINPDTVKGITTVIDIVTNASQIARAGGYTPA